MQPFQKRSHPYRKVGFSNLLFPFIACFLMAIPGAGCHQEAASTATIDAPQQEAGGEAFGPDAETSVRVTYFHTNYRCPTCRRLEEYSRETVARGFEEQISDGKVLYRVINVDDPENQHFVKDYNLYTKSLIVSQVKNGKEVRWKNLPDIWKHVGNRERFEQYVRGEIEAILKDL